MNQTSKRFGKIRKRYVLYRGEDAVLENGIEYRNVEAYLKELQILNKKVAKKPCKIKDFLIE